MYQSSNSTEHSEYSSPPTVEIPPENTSGKILAFAGVVLVTALGILLGVSEIWQPPQNHRISVETILEKPVKNSIDQENSEEIVTGKEITDPTVLETLNQKLYNSLDQSWQLPVTETSVYRVRVEQTGVIVSYQPQNQAASENLKNTPLPSLIQVNSSAAGDKPIRDFAEFEVIFDQTGKLDVYSAK